MIHGHGGDNYKYRVKYDFSSNIVPAEFNKKLLTLISNLKFDFTHYPEPDASQLVRMFQNHYNLPANSTIALNGATEGIYLWAELFRGSRFLISFPSFSEYEDAAKRYGSQVIFCSLDKLEREILKCECIFLCNPNNPNGALLRKEDILKLIESYQDKYFFIDEAYMDLCLSNESLLNYVDKYRNIFILKSITKFFSIPGVRLGFLSFNPVHYERVLLYKYPWSINSCAIEIGKLIFSNFQEIKPNIDDYMRVVVEFYENLKSIKYLEVEKSSTNFFLCKSEMKSSSLKELLIREYKILIRDASNFRGLTDYHFRVSTQTPKANEELIKALCSILK